MKKIYGDYYAILLDENNLVVWACGSNEWMLKYQPHPSLTYAKTYGNWTVN